MFLKRILSLWNERLHDICWVLSTRLPPLGRVVTILTTGGGEGRGQWIFVWARQNILVPPQRVQIFCLPTPQFSTCPPLVKNWPLAYGKSPVYSGTDSWNNLNISCIHIIHTVSLVTDWFCRYGQHNNRTRGSFCGSSGIGHCSSYTWVIF